MTAVPRLRRGHGGAAAGPSGQSASDGPPREPDPGDERGGRRLRQVRLSDLTARVVRRLPGGVRVGGEVAARAARRAAQDRVHGLAAEASFWTMLSMPPLLLALLGLIGQLEVLFGPGTAERVATAILDWADGVFTDRTMDEVVRPLVAAMLREGNSSVVSIGIVLALWSGSAALSNYVTAITVAYDMEGLRSFWRSRLLSLGLYVAALLIGAVLLPLLVLGPDLLERLLAGLPGPDVSWLVSAAYWPVVGVLGIGALTSLYHICVPTRTRWRRDLPGALLALLIWVAGAAGMRAYLASSLRSDTGPAGAPIAVLIFFFLTALAVLIGAELNAAIDARWPDRETQRGRRVARKRRAEGEREQRAGEEQQRAEDEQRRQQHRAEDRRREGED